MSTKGTTQLGIRRLQKEYAGMLANPPPHIDAAPDDSNIHLWYYVIEGPSGTPYEGGVYVGRVRFPPEYPYAPPSIVMTTPNGRFSPDTRLCFSMTDFHPKEWNPIWSVSTILSGLLSFMLDNAMTHGSIETTSEYKREMAVLSHQFNVRLPQLKSLFPNWFAFCTQQLARIERIASGAPPLGPEAYPVPTRRAAAQVKRLVKPTAPAPPALPGDECGVKRPVLTDDAIRIALVAHPEYLGRDVDARLLLDAVGQAPVAIPAAAATTPPLQAAATSTSGDAATASGAAAIHPTVPGDLPPASPSTTAYSTSASSRGEKRLPDKNNSWAEGAVRLLQIVAVGCMAVLVGHVILS